MRRWSLCRNSGWVGGTIDGDAYAFPVRSVAQIPTTTLAPPVNIPRSCRGSNDDEIVRTAAQLSTYRTDFREHHVKR